MKKLIVLCLVLAMVSVSWGVTAAIKVADNDVKDSYLPSDTLTIELVADFYVAFLGIDYVYGLPAGSSPDMYSSLKAGAIVNVGDVVNDGTTIIAAVAGQIEGFEIEDGVPPGAVIWTFEYHIPEVEASTVLTITPAGVSIADAWYMSSVSSIAPLELHVIPEPMTIALFGLGGLMLRRKMKK